ncbi:MAG: glycosyltransferase family 2 protein [Solirubrobacterales bacterium]
MQDAPFDASAAATRDSLDADLVTVVIPARNEEDFIGPCLESILAQDEQNLQVLVVDGCSTDQTVEIVLEYSRGDPRVELLVNEAVIIPTALNLALTAARGTWLVRVDAHATVPPDYVSRAVAHLRTGRWGAVGGRKDGVGVTAAGRAIAAAMGSRFGVGGSVYHYGTDTRIVDHVPFGAYPTALAREIGGWDERLAVNQDFEFDRRLHEHGNTILFDPALRIDWHCRQSVRALFRQYHRYGSGKLAVMRLHPRSTRLRHFAPPALVAASAVALALVPWRSRLVLLVIVPYAVAVAAASAVAGRQLDDRAAKALLPPAFFAMHLGWGLGFWRGVVRVVGNRYGFGVPPCAEGTDPRRARSRP